MKKIINYLILWLVLLLPFLLFGKYRGTTVYYFLSPIFRFACFFSAPVFFMKKELISINYPKTICLSVGFGIAVALLNELLSNLMFIVPFQSMLILTADVFVIFLMNLTIFYIGKALYRKNIHVKSDGKKVYSIILFWLSFIIAACLAVFQSLKWINYDMENLIILDFFPTQLELILRNTITALSLCTLYISLEKSLVIKRDK
ncbi:MAG: hypothetical protein FWG90_07065 [Oscillospiraceae bacterium]|nr:hypothetical protein [Oscillospiraceae bacterium]